MWPSDAESLMAFQEELATTDAPPWVPGDGTLRTAGCWVCFPRGQTGPGRAGDPAWTAAAVVAAEKVVDRAVVAGTTGAPYVPGLLALRIGPSMDQAIRELAIAPHVVFVDGTGRDHPRRAGLALHLGAVLGVPTVGVTHRPLRARGDWPDDRRGATAELRIGGDVVAAWLRTKPGVRPLVVHPGWRVDLATAVDLVLAQSSRARTPEPLRAARRLAREAREAGAREAESG
jgi:deoxyribonuclease V